MSNPWEGDEASLDSMWTGGVATEDVVSVSVGAVVICDSSPEFSAVVAATDDKEVAAEEDVEGVDDVEDEASDVENDEVAVEDVDVMLKEVADVVEEDVADLVVEDVADLVVEEEAVDVRLLDDAVLPTVVLEVTAAPVVEDGWAS